MTFKDATTISLAKANQAFVHGKNVDAMSGYIKALLKMPEIAKTFSGNIIRTREQYLKSRVEANQLKVVVCGWELSHNAAGRAHSLAEIYREITEDVEIVGSIFPRWGTSVWEPIRSSSIPIHTFLARPGQFIEQALMMVAQHPADIVHLSKPRAPNIFFGILYKILWGSKVIVDIDEEELVFAKAETPLNITEYLNDYQKLPPLDQLTDAHWTRIAVGQVHNFDGITVSNAALQRRYGGVVIGHVRDPRILKPSALLRQESRKALGIHHYQKVVLFFGTPRRHKGLIEVARAIQSLRRKNIIFVIAGSFGAKNMQLKSDLQSVTEVNYIFIENQPLAALPSTLAIADCCVLFQDVEHPASKFQIPAKLSDALAMGVPVLVSGTEALQHPINAGAVVVTTKSNLCHALLKMLDKPSAEQLAAGQSYFSENLSLDIGVKRLKKVVQSLQDNTSQLMNQVMSSMGALSELSPKFDQGNEVIKSLHEQMNLISIKNNLIN